MATISMRTVVRIGNATLLVALAAIAGYVTVRALGGTQATRRDREVPALGGLRADTALARLGSVRLLGRTVEASDQVVAAGYVAWQEPVAGTLVPEQSIVRVGISRGPAGTVVPDVSGLTEADARQILADNGLRVGGSDTVRDTLEAGRVVTQRPAPGSSIRHGTVSLTLSAGVASIAVPHVAGLTLRDARRRLEAAGLVAGAVRTTNEGPPGIVRAQRPEAGVLVTSQSAVELTISEARP